MKIIDNRGENTLLNHLKSIPPLTSLDIATGYFEIGALLALEDFWHNSKNCD
jgi:hypothetical protein